MAFRVRNTSVSLTETILSATEAEANKIDLEPTQLKQYGSKYLYNPEAVSKYAPKVKVTANDPEHYLREDNQPVFEKEQLVLDETTGKWHLVKESQAFSYES